MDDAIARVEKKLQGFYDSLDPDERPVFGALLEAASGGPEVEGLSMGDKVAPPTNPRTVLKVANFVVTVHVPNPDFRPNAWR